MSCLSGRSGGAIACQGGVWSWFGQSACPLGLFAARLAGEPSPARLTMVDFPSRLPLRETFHGPSNALPDRQSTHAFRRTPLCGGIASSPDDSAKNGDGRVSWHQGGRPV